MSEAQPSICLRHQQKTLTVAVWHDRAASAIPKHAPMVQRAPARLAARAAARRPPSPRPRRRTPPGAAAWRPIRPRPGGAHCGWPAGRPGAPAGRPQRLIPRSTVKWQYTMASCDRRHPPPRRSQHYVELCNVCSKHAAGASLQAQHSAETPGPARCGMLPRRRQHSSTRPAAPRRDRRCARGRAGRACAAPHASAAASAARQASPGATPHLAAAALWRAAYAAVSQPAKRAAKPLPSSSAARAAPTGENVRNQVARPAARPPRRVGTRRRRPACQRRQHMAQHTGARLVTGP